MRVGIDGCKKGWFYFQFDGSGLSFSVVTALRGYLSRIPAKSVVLIDIPIGLRESGNRERDCDPAARKILGKPRASSVFPAPSRQAVLLPSESSHKEASEENRLHLGKGLSLQSWAIAPKIREVDELLRNPQGLELTIREVHPEVCFWGLRGKPMHHKKTTREGFEERRAVLTNLIDGADKRIEQALKEYKKKDVARDDILDALVAAYCAKRVDECCTLPASPETDGQGLPMEMLYLPLNVPRPKPCRTEGELAE